MVSYEKYHFCTYYNTFLVATMQLIITELFAQTGSLSTLPNSDVDYAVSIIPGAAQKESAYHYYPPKIAVPVGTTVA